MKQLIVCLFFFLFFSLTKEKIFFPKKSKDTITIEQYITDLNNASEEERKKFTHKYGFNAQYCSLEGIDENGKQGCYVSLYYNEYSQWFYFCGEIDMKGYNNFQDKEQNKDFVENYINFDKTIQDYFKKETNNKLKIDCVSQKLKYISLFYIIYSLLLL